jgi:hypothetical protein
VILNNQIALKLRNLIGHTVSYKTQQLFLLNPIRNTQKKSKIVHVLTLWVKNCFITPVGQKFHHLTPDSCLTGLPLVFSDVEPELAVSDSVLCDEMCVWFVL